MYSIVVGCYRFLKEGLSDVIVHDSVGDHGDSVACLLVLLLVEVDGWSVMVLLRGGIGWNERRNGGGN